jgi:hypothetical protein
MANPRTQVATLMLNFGVAAKNLKQMDHALLYFGECRKLIAQIEAIKEDRMSRGYSISGDDSHISERSLGLLNADVLVNIGVVRCAFSTGSYTRGAPLSSRLCSALKRAGV